MADDRLFDLVQAGPHNVLAPQEWQRGGIVTKQQNFLFRLQMLECSFDLGEVSSPQFFPFGTLLGQRIRFINWQSDQRGNDSQQNITADVHSPEARDSQIPSQTLPALQPHPAQAADKTFLAQFMIAYGQLQTSIESTAQFLDAFIRAGPRRLVAQANKGRVARVVAVGHDVIEIQAALQKPVQQMILLERVAQPNEAAVDPQEQPQHRISHRADFIIVPSRPLRRAGVMDVAYNSDSVQNRHRCQCKISRRKIQNPNEATRASLAMHGSMPPREGLEIISSIRANGMGSPNRASGPKREAARFAGPLSKPHQQNSDTARGD